MAVLYKFHEIEAILANDSQFGDSEKLLLVLEKIKTEIPIPPLDCSDFLNKEEHPLYLKILLTLCTYGGMKTVLMTIDKKNEGPTCGDFIDQYKKDIVIREKQEGKRKRTLLPNPHGPRLRVNDYDLRMSFFRFGIPIPFALIASNSGQICQKANPKGRPTIMPFIKAEMVKRADEGILCKSLKEECEYLEGWTTEQKFPIKPPTAKGIMNALRDVYNERVQNSSFHLNRTPKTK